MTKKIKQFLEESAAAEKVSLPTRIIVHRTRLSPKDIIRIKKSGQFGPVPKDEEVCELEVGGQVLAYGKIVQRWGNYFFKVLGLAEKEEENNES